MANRRGKRLTDDEQLQIKAAALQAEHIAGTITSRGRDRFVDAHSGRAVSVVDVIAEPTELADAVWDGLTDRPGGRDDTSGRYARKVAAKADFIGSTAVGSYTMVSSARAFGLNQPTRATMRLRRLRTFSTRNLAPKFQSAERSRLHFAPNLGIPPGQLGDER